MQKSMLNTPMPWHAHMPQPADKPTVQLLSQYFAPEAAQLIRYKQQFSKRVQAHEMGPTSDRGYAIACLDCITYYN